MLLGSYEINEVKSANLPQKVATAFTAVTGELVGAEYQPIAYIGKQIVNGTNYCVLAVQKIITAKPETRLVKMIIHEELNGAVSLISISGIAL